VYAPSFQEPSSTTLSLGVPVVQLQSDPNVSGKYTTPYPNGFTEAGQYQVVFYARDKADDYAAPRLWPSGAGQIKAFLPLVVR
jgi:hypothetical protein